MNITAHAAVAPQARPAEAPKKEYKVKRENDHIADRFEQSREFGNGVGGLVTGAVVETGIAAVKGLPLAWEIVENTRQAETLGPNIKFLSALGALPAAVLNLAVAPFVGGFKGARLAGKASDATKDALPKDAAPEYTNKRFSESGNESLTAHWIKSLEELGDRKLEPGQKKFDVPILAPIYSAVGSVVCAGISGVIGLVAGSAAGLLTTGKEAWAGITSGDIKRAVFSPVFTVAVPYGLLKSSLLESAKRGFFDGGKHGLLKPIVDTAKISSGLAGSVLKEAWER